MKKIKWSGVKKVFLEIVGVLVVSAVFLGVLFALAEPFLSKGECVWLTCTKSISLASARAVSQTKNGKSCLTAIRLSRMRSTAYNGTQTLS